MIDNGDAMSSNHKDENLRELDEANLTAYALGQLAGRELAEVEALLLRSENARQFVAETSRWAAQVREAYQNCPTPEPSATLRDTLQAELQKTSKSQIRSSTMSATTNRKRSFAGYLIGLSLAGIAASVLVALLISDRPPARVAKSLSHNTSIETADSKMIATAPAEAASRPISVGKEWKYKPGGQMASNRKNASDKPRDYNEITEIRQYNYPPPPISASTPPVAECPPPIANVSGPAIAAKPSSSYSSMEGLELRTNLNGQPAPDLNRYLGQKPADESEGAAWHDGLNEGEPAPNLGPNAEQYDPIRDNPFLLVAKQPLSTFSIDVDTASYANIRRFLREGRLPPPDAVRIEEMVNYFPYSYSPPTDGAPFAVNMETAQCPWETKHRLLRIGLKGREIDRKNRGASNLVFLLDVSGSMNESNKLPLVKEAMKMLAGQLGEDDRVAIVTYASDTRVALPSARGNERERIVAAIDALQAGGCTYGSGGIQLAYQQAADHFVPGGVNRVILCTDGDLNVGVTRDEELVEMIQEKAKSGVFLTVLGFGEGNLKDSKMQKLADKGNGIYAYIDSMREAHRMLVEQMTGSLVTIAKDVKIQIEFNPAAVRAYRLVGYEKRLMANQDFSDDRKDAGEIGAGHTVTALYELVPAGADESDAADDPGLKYQSVPRVPREKLAPAALSSELLTLKIRYKEPEQNTSKLLEFTAKDSDKRFGEATADFRFAAAVASFGMMLRSSPYRGNLNYAAVAEFAAGALDHDPNGYRAEFLDLVRGAGKLSAGMPQ
jgi:Ca-activated chloride channel homolog